MAYLDNTGLAYFWGKIKAWANSVFALLGHVHPSSDVTSMAGYSKPSSSSAIAAVDTLNQAVGKLEKGLETMDGNVVHKTGNESVAGKKTFTAATVVVRNEFATRGAIPQSSLYSDVLFCDSSGAEWDASGAHGRMGAVQIEYASASSSVRVKAALAAYDNIAGNSDSSTLAVGFDSQGRKFAQAPQTDPDGTNGSDILTRSWDDYLVHKLGNETINNHKFFTSTLSVASDFAHNTIPSGNFAQRVALHVRPTAPWDTSNDLLQLIAIRQRAVATPGNPSSSSAYQSATSLRTIAADGNWAGLDLVVRDDTHEVFAALTYNNSVFKNLGWYGRLTGTVYSDAISDTADAQNYSDVVNARRTDSTRVFTLRSGYDSTGNYTSVIVHPSSGAAGGGFIISNGGSTSNNLTSWCGVNWNPLTNNSYTLGIGGRRWKQLFAVSGTIDTSDERIKSSISEVPDAVLDAWAGVDFVQFKFNDAVSEKGEAAARLHSGVIAQRVDEAFRRAGLDASRYGLFCYDEWDADPDYGQEPDPDAEIVRVPMAAGNLYSIRYAEALCMEAAYQRRENARLKKRVADLEERLAALELRLGLA